MDQQNHNHGGMEQDVAVVPIVGQAPSEPSRLGRYAAQQQKQHERCERIRAAIAKLKAKVRALKARERKKRRQAEQKLHYMLGDLLVKSGDRRLLARVATKCSRREQEFLQKLGWIRIAAGYQK